MGSTSPVSLSPDGGLLLYALEESGGTQVNCTRFPSGEGRWQVSGDGGSGAALYPDSSLAYYMNTHRELMRVPLTREPAIRLGIPEKVFPTAPKVEGYAGISPAPDGKRFISVKQKDGEASKTGYKLLLIENWHEEFRGDR